MITILSNCVFMTMSNPPAWSKTVEWVLHCTWYYDGQFVFSLYLLVRHCFPSQVCLYWYLYLWGHSQSFVQRFLCWIFYIPSRSMELAGFHGDQHGVSNKRAALDKCLLMCCWSADWLFTVSVWCVGFSPWFRVLCENPTDTSLSLLTLATCQPSGHFVYFEPWKQ